MWFVPQPPTFVNSVNVGVYGINPLIVFTKLTLFWYRFETSGQMHLICMLLETKFFPTNLVSWS